MTRIESAIVDVYPFRRAADGAEFLMLKRRPDSRIGGTWQAVHGKIEQGETAWQAALRELAEETGLTPRGFWQLETVNTFYVARDDRILMCPCFAAELDIAAVPRLSDEHTDFRWISSEEAAVEFMWPGQRRAVGEILENIITPSAAEPFLRIALPDRSSPR